MSGPALFEREFGLEIAEVHRRLAYWLDGYAEANQRVISRLQLAFRGAAVALLAEAILWGLHLAGIPVTTMDQPDRPAPPPPPPPPPPDLGVSETRGGREPAEQKSRFIP